MRRIDRMLDIKSDIEMTLMALRRLEKKRNRPGIDINRVAYLEDPHDKDHNCKIHYPLKHERLKGMLKKGLNIADFICFKPDELDAEKIKRFLEKHKKVSIRHFHENEQKVAKCPVLYDVDDFEKILEFVRENNRNFYTLINQSISVKDSLFCGTIFLIDDGFRDKKFIMEYFRGPGTPRDIEKKNQSELSRQTGPGFWMMDTEYLPKAEYKKYEQLKIIIDETYCSTDVRPIIYEFSYYPYPVGKLKKNQIYWEWRLGDLNHYGVAGNILEH